MRKEPESNTEKLMRARPASEGVLPGWNRSKVKEDGPRQVTPAGSMANPEHTNVSVIKWAASLPGRVLKP